MSEKKLEQNNVDIYSEAIEYLLENPNKICSIWDTPSFHWSGILFQCLSPNSERQKIAIPHHADKSLNYCGDPCEIRSFDASAYEEDITNMVRSDELIPIMRSGEDSPSILPKKDVLEAFAKYQKICDERYSRSPAATQFLWGFDKKEKDDRI